MFQLSLGYEFKVISLDGEFYIIAFLAHYRAFELLKL